ncbi:MAG: N-acetylmuramic acid 6-phosphate etherase [Erysipelotrichaceae bacterium]|nr:N-acetylmuramic acid 6-phosphate etherase [Erysipelotrichaceae bacterium]MDD4643087.1 N-acetylmuramic acid 6-phosphate etherase [Erysipelotrichaceae bacterium]
MNLSNNFILQGLTSFFYLVRLHKIFYTIIIDIKDRHVDQNDFVICITASGRTPYVVSALRYLKSQKIKSALIVNNDNSIAEKYTDYPIIITPGPEVITGSTRLKSGTCTKMVLNMVTTITMAKIGRTYSNLMIKVNPCSNKMEQRLEYIMQQATGCTKDKAKDLLIQTNYDISLAIIMQIKNIGIVKAKERLKNYNNNVNEACK